MRWLPLLINRPLSHMLIRDACDNRLRGQVMRAEQQGHGVSQAINLPATALPSKSINAGQSPANRERMHLVGALVGVD
jgi:hypothetical protein